MYHKKLLIGVKKRVQSRVVEKDEKKECLSGTIAEKITFLSSNKGGKKQSNLFFLYSI